MFRSSKLICDREMEEILSKDWSQGVWISSRLLYVTWEEASLFVGLQTFIGLSRSLSCRVNAKSSKDSLRRQLIQGLVPPPALIEDNITAKSSKASLRQLHLQANHPKNRPRKEYHSILHPPNSNESKVTANTRYFSEKKKRISNKNEKNIK